MMQYVTVRLTLKQAEAAHEALTAAHLRAEMWCDLDKPHGTVKEQTAMFHLQSALVSGIREGRETLAKYAPRCPFCGSVLVGKVCPRCDG